ncbi:MAG: hypothetical protein ACOH2A_15035 [Sphingobacteriaceae bacterium]
MAGFNRMLHVVMYQQQSLFYTKNKFENAMINYACSKSQRFVSLLLITATLWTMMFDTNVVAQSIPSTMIGRQSNNEGIHAIPATGPIIIDGSLDDWDLSGQIWSFADVSIRDRYSTETAVMWSKEYLYLAFQFRDPTPLINTIDPDFNPQDGWKGDAIQLRFLTDWPIWITLWKYTAGDRSAMLKALWNDADDDRKGQQDKLSIAARGSTDLGDGVQMAYKINEDKKGYAQEVRIPWKLLYKDKVPEAVAGLNFRMGLDLCWGPSGESTFPLHRYQDNMQPGKTSREFFWTSKNVWGNVTLLEKGKVQPLKYIMDDHKLEGTIPIKITLPAKAKEFTVVIETKDSVRVRNLGAQLNPETYSDTVKNDQRIVQVLWDGLDDAGKIVPKGAYQVRGLSHKGLGADYVMSVFNPGTPPWDAGTSGNWGADHTAPQYVANAKDWTILAWSFAEGGSGIIGIGPDGLKKWGEKRGVLALTADENNVYFIARGNGSGSLCRLHKIDGTYYPFILDGKERPFELSLSAVFGSESAVPGEVIEIASSGEKLIMAMSGGKVALLDINTAKVLKIFAVPTIRAVTTGLQGQCYLISNNRLAQLNLETGALRYIATPGISIAQTTSIDNDPPTVQNKNYNNNQRAIAVDQKGFIGIFDKGIDQQVKFYSPLGKFQYAVGRKGGRPIRGNFDEQAMSHVSAVSVDHMEQIWVTESWEYPRRVSIWGKDGKLIRDYMGNSRYAGTGLFLHDSDPTLAYYGPVEMKLDITKRTWKVTRILWVPGKGEQFAITDLQTQPTRFSSNAGGKTREFMFLPPYESNPYVLYMESDDKTWRPVASIGVVGMISGELTEHDGKIIRQPDGPYTGLNAYDGYFWNDTNMDGKIQFPEVVIVPNPKPVKIGENGRMPIPYWSGWGGRMAPEDLSFFTDGVARYIPIRYTAEGAPVYGPASIKKYPREGSGDYVPVWKENKVLALMNRGNFATDGLFALNAETGKALWSYPNPYPGVHGSHEAPMPQPGLLIGPLKIMGNAAELPDGNGRVFAMRGNLGQDFYMTTDGLFIGTIFQDGRFPSLPLPLKEEELVGAPMESYGGGSEPFMGWFGKQRDGKFRLLSGIGRQSAMILEINGFENIKRFTASTLNVTGEMLTMAASDNDIRMVNAKKNTDKRQQIVKVNQAPSITGKNLGWDKIPSFTIESTASGSKGKAQLGYDAEYLYLAMDVDDPSPWKNEGINFLRLFKTGDAVDLQIGSDVKAPADRTQPGIGDLRIVISNLNNEPTAILMRPMSAEAPKNLQKIYTSPVGIKKFDEVRMLKGVKLAVVKNDHSYRLEAAISLKELGLKPIPGSVFKGDIGFISSDADGKINIARTYWANKATNLVSDEPNEAWLFPSSWGTFSWGE